jgi:hypothetical protein
VEIEPLVGHIKVQRQRSLSGLYIRRESLLAAYSIDGYIASRTLKGTCTVDIVEDFLIDHLLPLCNPFPQSRSVVILDNASVHHKNIYII